MTDDDRHARPSRRATFRFYAELNDYLPESRRQVRFIMGTPLVEDTPDNIKGHPKVREAYLGEAH